MTDIAELIRADHVRISRMIGQLSSALAQLYPADTGLEAGPAWDSLAGLLRLHVAAAEEIAYLALASAYPGAALAMTQASEVNADICAAIEEARLYRAGSRAWKMAVQAACRPRLPAAGAGQFGASCRLMSRLVLRGAVMATSFLTTVAVGGRPGLRRFV